jgi:hypothetical protein
VINTKSAGEAIGIRAFAIKLGFFAKFFAIKLAIAKVLKP